MNQKEIDTDDYVNVAYRGRSIHAGYLWSGRVSSLDEQFAKNNDTDDNLLINNTVSKQQEREVEQKRC